jgi:hypothetical protein
VTKCAAHPASDAGPAVAPDDSLNSPSPCIDSRGLAERSMTEFNSVAKSEQAAASSLPCRPFSSGKRRSEGILRRLAGRATQASFPYTPGYLFRQYSASHRSSRSECCYRRSTLSSPSSLESGGTVKPPVNYQIPGCSVFVTKAYLLEALSRKTSTLHSCDARLRRYPADTRLPPLASRAGGVCHGASELAR